MYQFQFILHVNVPGMTGRADEMREAFTKLYEREKRPKRVSETVFVIVTANPRRSGMIDDTVLTTTGTGDSAGRKGGLGLVLLLIVSLFVGLSVLATVAF